MATRPENLNITILQNGSNFKTITLNTNNSINLTTGDSIPVVKAVEYLQIEDGDSVKKVKTFELSTEYLKFYSDKTTLKGVKGKEVEYLISKEMLNSLYGMTVYNPIKTQYTYEKDEWNCEEKEINEKNIAGFYEYAFQKGVRLNKIKHIFTGL